MSFELASALLWKVTVLLIVALVVDRLLRHRRPLGVAAFWNAVLLAIIAVPVATLVAPRVMLTWLPALPAGQGLGTPAMTNRRAEFEDSFQARTDSDRRDDQESAKHDHVSMDRQPSSPAVSIIAGDRLLFVLAWVYNLGVVIALVRLIADIRAIDALRREARPVADSAWLGRFNHWAAFVGLSQTEAIGGRRIWLGGGPATLCSSVQLLKSDRIRVPVALGVHRPVIVIPAGMAEKITRSAADSILVHELAHVCRHDSAWQLVQRLVGAALWFHPLVWISRGRIAFIRERACDDFAIHLLGNADEYAETLLDVASRLTRGRSLALGMAVARTGNLAHRLTAIEQSQGSNRCLASPAARWSLNGGAVSFAFLIASFVIGRATPAEESVRTSPSAVGEATNDQKPVAADNPTPQEKHAEADQAADPEGAALQKKVIARIQENYDRFPVAHCKMVLTILSPKVKKREVIRGKTDRGATFEMTVMPRTIVDMELIFSRSSFRVDRVDQDTGERWSSAMHNGIWTDYCPGRDWAARWYRRDMAGITNWDPRNLCASGQKEIFLDELAGERVVKHETEKSENGERLVLHMERSIPAADIRLLHRYEFDPHRNYLPCRIVYYAPDDGKIISVMDLEYREVDRNSAWFPKKSTHRFFADRHAERPEQDGWTQQVTMELSPARTDEVFADTAFEIEIAPGIPLRDNTRGRQPPPEKD